MSTPPRSLVSLDTLIFALLILLFATATHAATPSSGTMSPGSAGVTWAGGPVTRSTSNPVAADCSNTTCASVGNAEQVSFTGAPGVYRISVLFYRAVYETYTAAATITTSPPEPPNDFRTATYQRYDFGFKPEVTMPDGREVVRKTALRL